MTPLLHSIHRVLAQGIVDAPRLQGYSTPSALVKTFCIGADWVFTAAILLSVLFALLAGIEYMTSSGDPAKVKSATNKLIFTAIGVGVALVAFFVPGIVAGIIGTSVGNAC